MSCAPWLCHHHSMLRSAAHLPGVRPAAALTQAAPRRLQRALLQDQVREDLLPPPFAAALEPEDQLGRRPVRVLWQTRVAADTIAVVGFRRLLMFILAAVFRAMAVPDAAADCTELVHIDRMPAVLTEVSDLTVGLNRRDGPGQIQVTSRVTISCKAGLAARQRELAAQNPSAAGRSCAAADPFCVVLNRCSCRAVHVRVAVKYAAWHGMPGARFRPHRRVCSEDAAEHGPPLLRPRASVRLGEGFMRLERRR